MSSEAKAPEHQAVLVLPHIRVQNANAISSPMTWGFPAITAFTGLMTALERRLGCDAGIALYGIGVVCHGFEAQVTTAGYTRAFRLTRNPVLADGSSAAIVEEGRAHLDVTLVFDVRLADEHRGEAERLTLAERVAHELAGMRLAGGSAMPALPGPARRSPRPVLELVPDEGSSDEQRKAHERGSAVWRGAGCRALPWCRAMTCSRHGWPRCAPMTRRPADWMPGWICRAGTPAPLLGPQRKTAISRPLWNGSPIRAPAGSCRFQWVSPPCLTSKHRAPSKGREIPSRRFALSKRSGPWANGSVPHRLKNLDDLVWFTVHDPEHPTEHGLYRCRNAYRSADARAVRI
ncbi:MAG: type I-F CRISPR-associated protein Csy2 [Chromatiales bacterium]|nr:type I-F CRISPR-associated protein Csy2 [Chromatiales bacterium]